jgi:hypothetical protein
MVMPYFNPVFINTYVYTVLALKIISRSLGRHRHRWEDNVKIYYTKTDCEV